VLENNFAIISTFYVKMLNDKELKNIYRYFCRI